MALGRSITAIAATIALGLPALAETVELSTGQILVGDVELRGANELVIRVRFPTQQTVTLKYEDVAARLLYDLLERRTDKGDAAGRRRLARHATEAGLYGAAIAEYVALKDLDPDQTRFADEQIGLLTEAIASDSLEEAIGLLEADNPRAALLYLHSVEELYLDTDAARMAKELMSEAHRRAGEATDVAEKTVAAEGAPGVLSDIARDLARGDKTLSKVGGHEGLLAGSSAQRRALDKAIRSYERAWKNAKRLPVAVRDEALRGDIEAVRQGVRKRLVAAHLSAASIQLQRRSIPKAEEYCNRACELAPDSKRLHTIHGLIIEAKAYGY